MATEKIDDDRGDDEAARADADEPVAPTEVTPASPEGDECMDPGPGRDPRPDLRGA